MTISKTLLIAIQIFNMLSNSQSITLRPPQAAPVTKPVDHGFTGIAFGGHYFPDYTLEPSGDARKLAGPEFSQNLIGTLAERSGAAVSVRVGGTVLWVSLLYTFVQRANRP